MEQVALLDRADPGNVCHRDKRYTAFSCLGNVFLVYGSDVLCLWALLALGYFKSNFLAVI